MSPTNRSGKQWNISAIIHCTPMRMKSVSYTHLDVYKRQAKAAEDFSSPIGALLTVEEGGVLDGSMERLEQLFEKNVRLLTLTWNKDNCIGHPNHRDKEKNALGLTPFGFEVICRMEELGMIVDVSHLSDGGFYDVARTMKKPFVASHSNARALCGHPRNLTDDMLKLLAKHGGVAGLNFCPAFLDEKAGCTVEAMTCLLYTSPIPAAACCQAFWRAGMPTRGPVPIRAAGNML